jgi:hypothetical protein
MKRILLTTTSLVLAAGVAQADITFSGTAGIALIDDNGASVAGTATSASLAADAITAAGASTAAAAGLTAARALNTGTASTALLTAEATYAAIVGTPTALQETALTTAGTTYATAIAAATDAVAALEAQELAAGRAAVAAGTAATAANTKRDAGANAANAASRATRDGMFFESYYDFNITASAESDNGVSVSVGFDMGAGNKIDYNDDDQLEAQGVDVGDADVSVSYAGWTVAVDQAGIDNLFDDTDGAQDVSLSGTVGGMSVAVTTDLEGSTNSYKVAGSVAGVALTITGTNNDDNAGSASKIAASYAMGNGLTLKGSVEDESKADGSEDDSTLGFSYAMDALTVGYTTIKPGSNGSLGDEWDFSVAYAAGATSASFALDETDATTIIVDHALGGGASAFAAMHDKAGTDNDLTAVGLNFAF